jgi:hypothetical protein
MCGLVLLVNKNKNGFSAEQRDVFGTLLYLSGHFRGRDGAGVVAIDNIGNVKLAKQASTVDRFFCTKEYQEVAQAAFARGWAMFGHNRAATRGAVNDANSHPFVVDDKIVLVHNGTFFGDHKKLKETEVDSEVIAHTLADDKLTTEEALRKIDAAYALIWYNVDKKELNVVRNNARPLWFMETSDSYIFASEESFLEFVKKKFTLNVRKAPFEIKAYALSKFWLNDKNEADFNTFELDCSFHKHNPTTGGTGGTRYPFQNPASGEGSGESAIEYAAQRHRHPYAGLGWGANDDDDGSNDGFMESVPERATSIIIDTKSSVVKTRILAALGQTNGLRGITNEEWITLMEHYGKQEKVRVVVNDLIEADDYPKTKNFILLGKTLDDHRVDVCFPVKDQSLDAVIQLTNDAVFELKSTGVTWDRMDNLFGKQDDEKDMKKWRGCVLVHGVDPQPIFLAAANENAF